MSFVKIKGISHPFSTVKGLKEDVLTFLLNVKLIKFAYTAEEEQKLVLKKKGKGKVYAKDIEDSTLCKVVNGDLYLGELAEDGSLEVELTLIVVSDMFPRKKKSHVSMVYFRSILSIHQYSMLLYKLMERVWDERLTMINYY